MTDPTKVERTPNGLIIDDGRGNIRVHEFDKQEPTGRERMKADADLRAQNADSAMKEASAAEKRIAMGLEHAPKKPLGERIGNVLKSKWAIGAVVIAGAATIFQPVRDFITGTASSRGDEAKVGQAGKEAERRIFDAYKPHRDMTIGEDGSVGPVRQQLGRYADAFSQTRDLITQTALRRGLEQEQVSCVVAGFDTALKMSASQYPLATTDDEANNAKGFVGAFEQFGNAQMDICGERADVPSNFTDGLKDKVFAHKGSVMQQLFPENK